MIDILSLVLTKADGCLSYIEEKMKTSKLANVGVHLLVYGVAHKIFQISSQSKAGSLLYGVAVLSCTLTSLASWKFKQLPSIIQTKFSVLSNKSKVGKRFGFLAGALLQVGMINLLYSNFTANRDKYNEICKNAYSKYCDEYREELIAKYADKPFMLEIFNKHGFKTLLKTENEYLRWHSLPQEAIAAQKAASFNPVLMLASFIIPMISMLAYGNEDSFTLRD